MLVSAMAIKTPAPGYKVPGLAESAIAVAGKGSAPQARGIKFHTCILEQSFEPNTGFG